MQSALSLSFSQASLTTPNLPISSSNVAPRNLRLCGLRREAFGFSTPKQLTSCRFQTRSNRIEVSAAAGNGAPSDYDLVIIGAGVGGHGAALHAVFQLLVMTVMVWLIMRVTFIEALDQLMPGFDPEISKLAGSKVDAALIATGRAPFTKMVLVWTLENINVATQRGFIPVDERMRVIDGNGKLVPHLYCIGDANGKLMLAHAASAQGISGRDHVLNHLSIPAACFTHPEISMVGLTEPQAREKAEKEGFKVSIAKDKFQGEHKGPTALAENEGEGLAKMIYRPDNGEILGVHIFGLHAADLIHEASNAIALGTRIQPDFSGFILMMVQDIKLAVHAHPTLSEVVDELFKAAKVESPASTTAQSVKAAV
ncbi:hypothetical protein Bca101_078744 [Brassica carinata]